MAVALASGTDHKIISGCQDMSHVALVTGAGRGLGRAVAVALAGRGADLALLGRTAHDLEGTADEVRALGRRALPLPADVSRREQVRAAVEQATGALGPVAVLVNNAAVATPVGPLVDNDPADWSRTVAVNLLGAVHCIQAVLPGMIERRAGRIVNLSGGGATAPLPGQSAYAASKSALVRLTETLAAETAAYGIRVNAVAPGRLPTQMLGVEPGPPPPEGAIERAAALVAFLASDDAGSLTGKLVSAVHDPWEGFGPRADDLNAGPLYTLRRIDPFTIGQAG